MHRARTKGRLNISDAGPRFGSTKLAGAALRGALTLALLSVLLLIAARPVQAQILTALHNFTGGDDGGGPRSPLTSDGAGNLYGTTGVGGLGAMPGPTPGAGTVFELSPNGGGGWNETVLYSFCEPYGMTTCPDGFGPSGPVIFDSVGNLYGTTCYGGANGNGNGAPGYGVVFELSPVGTSWMETVLYNFTGGANGACPANGLIMDPAGNLYGTSSAGIFQLSPCASCWTEQLIYAFGYAALTIDAAGNIFGNAEATAFELSPNGKGGWNSTSIHTFHNYDVYFSPLVLDQAGNLYGTRTRGGAKGFGAVFKLSPAKNGEWTKTALYSFEGGNDGRFPDGGLVLDAAGNLYGTTAESFGACCHRKFFGYGNVFELVAGSDQLKVLWSFSGTDGEWPYGTLILDSAGNLYGITAYGGLGGDGVAFELTP